MSDQIDSRLTQAADSVGLKYEIHDGDLHAVVQTTEERSQLVVVEGETYEFANVEMRRIRSLGYRGNYPKANVLVNCLEQNAKYKIGAWEIHLDRDEKTCVLVFCEKVGAGLDGARLKAVILAVAQTADHMEKQLLQTDDL